MTSTLEASSHRLWRFIFENYWDGDRVVGPDTGLMFDLRVFRFIKSYFPVLGRSDQYCFMQAQGYWIRNNWDLSRLTGKETYKVGE